MSSAKKILIAEDEIALAQILSQKLKEEGFEVEVAANGIEAMASLSKKTFDLLLLDLIMPKMDGFEVLNQMKIKKIRIKILVMSNLSQTETAAKARSLGANNFLVKSDISLGEIIKRVKSIL